MQEPIKAKSLDDLGDVIVTVTIRRPDNKRVDVELRALSEPEVTDIRHSIDWPDLPPVKDYDGKGNPIRNYDDKDYRKRVGDTNLLFAQKCLLAMIQIDIPGETESDKLKELKKKMGQYALSQLIRAIDKINNIEEKDIDNVVSSFRPARNGHTPAHGAAGLDDEPVGELAEARED